MCRLPRTHQSRWGEVTCSGHQLKASMPRTPGLREPPRGQATRVARPVQQSHCVRTLGWMRAEFLDLDVQFTHQVVRLTPVAVRGVHDDCLRHNRHGREIAVRRGKRVLWQFLEPTPVVVRRRDRESAYSGPVILAVVYVLEERVPDAGCAREAEIGSVLSAS